MTTGRINQVSIVRAVHTNKVLETHFFWPPEGCQKKHTHEWSRFGPPWSGTTTTTLDRLFYVVRSIIETIRRYQRKDSKERGAKRVRKKHIPISNSSSFSCPSMFLEVPSITDIYSDQLRSSSKPQGTQSVTGVCKLREAQNNPIAIARYQKQ